MEEKGKAVAAEYAGFWMRLGAYLIDAIALSIAGSIITGFIGLITLPFAVWGWMMPHNSLPNFMPFFPWWFFTRAVWSFVWLVVSGGYFICFWALRGQTLGMMALRIKLIRSDGSAIDWGASIIRFLGYIICWITAGLLFLWVAFDSRKQGIHDKMADSCVIVLPRQRIMLQRASQSG